MDVIANVWFKSLQGLPKATVDVVSEAGGQMQTCLSQLACSL
jgi:hypothetical protein